MKSIGIIAFSLLSVSPFCAFGADAKANWTNNCVQCHGSDGRADTTIGKMLNAPNFTTADVQASFTDAQAFDVIKNGVIKNGESKMIAFRNLLTDDEIKALVAYLRTLKK